MLFKKSPIARRNKSLLAPEVGHISIPTASCGCALMISTCDGKKCCPLTPGPVRLPLRGGVGGETAGYMKDGPIEPFVGNVGEGMY